MITQPEQLYEVLSCLPDPAFVLSENGVYVDVLGGTDTQSYHNGKALIGRSLFDVLPTDKANWFASEIMASLNQNKVRTVEYDLSADDVNGLNEKPLPLGLLRFEGKICPLSFTYHGHRVVLWLVRNISEHYRLETQLREQSETDSLTGIANRRFFFHTLNSLIHSKRTDDHLSQLALIDIDFFKNVNDTFGHQAGDFILVSFVKLMQQLIRKSDVLARMGGEEFALLLPNTHASKAEKIAQRIKQATAAQCFNYDNHSISMTISMGITSIVLPTTDKDIFSQADIALYRAKAEGRNRVIVYTPESTSHCP
ncbi:hypothetical protein BCU70_10065 [Vibrio sp. 10N.286.49.C2]|uniref:sensor domain-containing diguanylate cyclase n=1 Tax=unclassified Vibrio TaxID=2614977 RepID=UPI000C863516|nr:MULTISPECIES: GGDEF domain-containing protein [unclassified Vibrio]PMH26482.1 hypothetical protein BCU70_10065 [Vibrio sp. 10N.286.49.C2]PMH54794.1 hypothetical protein BCU66_10870 [Vibrio sp. 10N.286.49.B1]PMH83970.1 hypothetical protein BCU58_12770 [Vibrio sp. 10N.286.48.B7]